MVTKKINMSVSVRENMRGGAGSARLEALCGELPKNLRLFSAITLAPGSGIGYHVHENETELFAFIAGRGRVRDDDEWVDVEAGDCMTTPSGHGHAVENTGDTDLSFIAAIALD